MLESKRPKSAIDGSGVGTSDGTGVGQGVVGAGVGVSEGNGVGFEDGTGVGMGVGATVGSIVGTPEGSPVGTRVGFGVGTGLGGNDGAMVGGEEGDKVGNRVGVAVGAIVGGVVMTASTDTMAGTVRSTTESCPRVTAVVTTPSPPAVAVRSSSKGVIAPAESPPVVLKNCRRLSVSSSPSVTGLVVGDTTDTVKSIPKSTESARRRSTEGRDSSTRRRPVISYTNVTLIASAEETLSSASAIARLKTSSSTLVHADATSAPWYLRLTDRPTLALSRYNPDGIEVGAVGSGVIDGAWLGCGMVGFGTGTNVGC